MLQRFLDPAVLRNLAGLDLIAKTVVDGFISGLHRSPDFGFSQEFAEYRAYTPGDDLRHVDWNVFARTERAFLKRYRGETNCQVNVLLDVSRSMSYAANGRDKLEYAKFLAASVLYLAHLQRDAAGLIVFDDEVRNFVPPSTRQGQLHRLLHGIEQAQPGRRTDFARPFAHLMDFLRRRGVVVAISDFWENPQNIVDTVAPLRFRGNELVLFHVLDPDEIRPKLKHPVMLEDLETGETMEVTPDYAAHEYRDKMQAHLESIEKKAKGAGMDYFLVDTGRPLDAALREYLAIRTGRL
ncbi:MAG TPA: DUF58 domain-containing protein [Bryobacteraceae bacterium]|nr:DUF58 domain-containing protein [Bryobacteraceae bacterium]